MSKFGDAERNILKLLNPGNSFTLHTKVYKIVQSGKPTCRKGEPKTDIYVLASSEDHNFLEIKISFKKENADFIENKTNSERAKILLGHNWQDLIIKATSSISDKFKNKKHIYKSKSGRTEEGSITLGWKYELLNKSGGELSGILDLTPSQIIDVYAGTHLSDDKKNASVNGQIIINSGIANYILINDRIRNTQDIIDNLIPIEKYVQMHPTVYFACKALNYRTYKQKYDGNRPLSVFVDWNIKNGQLNPVLIFNNPLLIKGDYVASKLINSMEQLGIHSTRDINEKLVTNPSIIFK